MPRLLLVLALLGLAVPASATETYEEWKASRAWLEVCGGEALFTCGSIQLDFSPTKINIRLWNLSGLHGSDPYTLFNSISIGGLPSVLTPQGEQSDYNYVFGVNRNPQFMPTGPGGTNLWELYSFGPGELNAFGYWRFPYPYEDLGRSYFEGSLGSTCGAPKLDGINVMMSPTCGSDGLNNPTANDGWFELALTTREGYFVKPVDLAGLSVTVGASNLWASTYRGELTCGGSDSNCSSVVPEPASMALLGIGLAGLGAFRRRRRDRADVV